MNLKELWKILKPSIWIDFHENEIIISAHGSSFYHQLDFRHFLSNILSYEQDFRKLFQNIHFQNDSFKKLKYSVFRPQVILTDENKLLNSYYNDLAELFNHRIRMLYITVNGVIIK